MVAATVEPDVISLQEVAKRLDMNPRVAYRLVAEARFPIRTVRIGKRIVVPVRAFEAFLSGETPGDQTAA